MSDRPYVVSSDGSVNVGATVAATGVRQLHLDGVELSFIRVDHQARLQLGSTEVVIETPFKLIEGSKKRNLDPGRRSGLGPLLGLYPGVVASATITHDCTLRLVFAEGQTIEVPRHPQYEAWQIVGPESRLIVCPPGEGAGLAVWQ